MPRIPTLLLAFVTLLSTAGPVLAVTAEPMDIEPEIAAKMAKEKSKLSLTEREDQKKRLRHFGTDELASCGSINIGNNFEVPRGFAPKPITVVILGDVINANNKCR